MMLAEQPFLMGDGLWIPVRDGNHTARNIFDRHYSRKRYRDGRAPVLFCGPGEKMVLLTACARAVLVWRRFIDDCIDDRTGKRQIGVNCAVFRNETQGGG